MGAHDLALDPPDDGYRHPDAMPSRASILADGAGRDAKERAEQARSDVRRHTLDRGSFTLGRVGTQLGREVEVIWEDGKTLVTDVGTALGNGLLFALDVDQAGELVDLLTSALEDLNTAPKGPVGRVDIGGGVVIVVERTAIGIQIRNEAIRNHGGVLVQMHGVQAKALITVLSKAIGR